MKINILHCSWAVTAAIAAVSASQVPFTLPKAQTHLIPSETHEYLENLLKRYNSTGLSVAVVKKTDEGEWLSDFGSYGIATAVGSKVTPDTQFSIASNSKLFLALSVGLLISNETLAAERGKALNWNSKARDVFGQDLWKLWDKDAERMVTLQDMLSHRTGLPRHDATGRPREGGVREVISTLRYLKPSAEPRERYQYNNLMYESLAYLPTLFFNESYASYISRTLFQPLGMNGSTLSLAEAESWGTLANGFSSHLSPRLRPDKPNLRAAVPFFVRPGSEDIWAGAGGVISSARDLTTWVLMLLNDGRHPITNEVVVPAEVVQHVATGIVVASGKAQYPELSPVVYGAGQSRFTYQGHELVEHGGHNPGYHTQISRYPNDNVGIVVLTNDENAYWLTSIVRWRLTEDLLGLKRIDWEGRYAKERQEVIEKMDATTPSPARPPSPSFEEMEGAYHHPTYGGLSLCSVYATSQSCNDTLSHPVAIQVLKIMQEENKNLTKFIAPIKTFFTTYVLFSHFDQNVFNITFVWDNWDVRRNETYVKTQTPQDDGALITFGWETFPARWFPSNSRTGEPSGLAFGGNFWGAEGGETSKTSYDIPEGREDAKAWFKRV